MSGATDTGTSTWCAPDCVRVLRGEFPCTTSVPKMAGQADRPRGRDERRLLRSAS